MQKVRAHKKGEEEESILDTATMSVSVALTTKDKQPRLKSALIRTIQKLATQYGWLSDFEKCLEVVPDIVVDCSQFIAICLEWRSSYTGPTDSLKVDTLTQVDSHLTLTLTPRSTP